MSRWQKRNLFNTCRCDEIVIPDGVITIGDSSFECCESLNKINLPDSITSIGYNAFGNCISLKTISIADGITSIESSTFSMCKSLTSILIPDSVTNIDDYAFYQCDSLNTIFGYQDSYAEEYAATNSLTFVLNQPGLNIQFAPVGLIGLSPTAAGGSDGKIAGTTTAMEYKKSTASTFTAVTGTEITGLTSGTYNVRYKAKQGYSAGAAADILITNPTVMGDFNYTTTSGKVKITGYKGAGGQVVIPSQINGNPVETIGTGAFTDCNTITSVEIPTSVLTIGQQAFENCTSLVKATLPDSITSIGLRAFINNTSLISVNIPNNITTVPLGLFSLCTSLTDIVIPQSVTTIEDEVFYSCSSLENVTIPDSVTNVSSGSFYCSRWLNNYPGDFVVVGDGILIQYNGTDLDISVPNGVKKIAFYAFAQKPVVSVNLPDSLKEISYAAFQGCSILETVNFSDGLEVIGSNVFTLCSTLTSLDLPESLKTIKSLAFTHCYSLTNVYIPRSVTAIESSVFSSSENVVISCYSDSYAKNYAIANSINYSVIDEQFFSISGYVEYPGETVTVNSESATSDANGYFSFDSMSPGNYSVIITRPGALKRTIPVTVSDTDIVLSDITNKLTVIIGDANQDDLINVSDITAVKNDFTKTSADAGFNTDCDVNQDDSINVSDISAVKSNFGKTTNSY